MSDLPILDELGESVHQAARRRRSLRAPAAVTAVVLGAVAAVLVIGGGSPRPLAERAFAAVADDAGARHVVYEETLTRAVGPDVVQRTEVWQTADGCRGRARYLDGRGRVRGDLVEDAGSLRAYDGRTRTLLRTTRRRGDLWQVSDPVEAFRSLYRRGRVVESGRFERGGRELVRFRLSDGDLTMTYLTDAATFVPREVVLRDERRTLLRARILTYELLPEKRARPFLTLPRYRAKPRSPERPRGAPPLPAGDVPRSQQRVHCYR